MMFIFTILLMLALGAVLYLMVRALPRVTDEPEAKESFLDRWAHSELPEKIDTAFNSFLVKFLRRVKVFALKFDNAVSAGLRQGGRRRKRERQKTDIRTERHYGTEEWERGREWDMSEFFDAHPTFSSRLMTPTGKRSSSAPRRPAYVL